MKEIKFYQVRYEGYSNPVETDDFETIELAKEFAKNSKSALYCRLYKITMIFNGTVTRNESFITYLKTPRHNEYIDNKKWRVEVWKRQIKEVEDNKRMKAENKAKQIEDYKRCMKNDEEIIKEYYETYK